MTAYIYTDASFFTKHNVGSFAFWIECRGKTIQVSGVLKNAKNSTEAETMCIGNALYSFIDAGFKKVDDIIITTDSEQSILKINSRARKFSSYKIAYDLLKDIRRINKIKTRLKHNFKYVAAHSELDTVEKLINNWCDIEARRIGREYIKNNYK